MKLIRYNTKEHRDILKVFSHSSKVEKKVMINVAYEINKLKEEDYKGKNIYTIEIPMSDLMERTETNYKAINRICDKVTSKKILIEIPYKLRSGKTEIFKSTEVCFPACGISENTFKIKVNEDVIPLFSRALECYRHYNIIEAKFLTHKHSIEFYKFLKDKLNISKYDFKITVENLKNELGLENKYKLYADFKKWVLEPAKKDMFNNGFIYFDYKEIKHSRSITGLHLTIHEDIAKKLTLYSSERLKTYLKTETKTQFKKDFEAFLNESETYKPKLKGLLIELKNKSSLSEYDKNTQLEFINFIEPNLL